MCVCQKDDEELRFWVQPKCGAEDLKFLGECCLEEVLRETGDEFNFLQLFIPFPDPHQAKLQLPC